MHHLVTEKRNQVKSETWLIAFKNNGQIADKSVQFFIHRFYNV